MTFAKAVCGVWILLYAWGSRKNERRLARKEVVLKEEKGLEMTAAPGMEEGEDDHRDDLTRHPDRKAEAGGGSPREGSTREESRRKVDRVEEEEEVSSIWAALFLGLALAARGEIGLLISQIGYTVRSVLFLVYACPQLIISIFFLYRRLDF
jgi:hypothetical protein